MPDATQLSCACGTVRLTLEREPIIVAECHCTSCRAGGERLRALPGARPVQAANGGTPYVLYRKDRVRFVAGADQLREFRLTPASPTRRAVAACCNTPIFVEFQDGHWLSLYATLWPKGTAPQPELRTQTGDRTGMPSLPADVPSGRWPTAKFYGRLLGAWVAMGFSVPKVEVRGSVEG